jgi:hypothetical protein
MSFKKTFIVSAIMILTMVGFSYLSHRENICPNKPLSTFPRHLEKKVDKILSGKVAQGKVPELWDGQTASRVLESIKKIDLMG